MIFVDAYIKMVSTKVYCVFAQRWHVSLMLDWLIYTIFLFTLYIDVFRWFLKWHLLLVYFHGVFNKLLVINGFEVPLLTAIWIGLATPFPLTWWIGGSFFWAYRQKFLSIHFLRGFGLMFFIIALSFYNTLAFGEANSLA